MEVAEYSTSATELYVNQPHHDEQGMLGLCESHGSTVHAEPIPHRPHQLVLRYHSPVLSPPSMGALKWMFTFKVSLPSAKPTQQLTQYPLVQISSQNTAHIYTRR